MQRSRDLAAAALALAALTMPVLAGPSAGHGKGEDKGPRSQSAIVDEDPYVEQGLKEELRNVEGTDSLHPTRSGDVVIVVRPPYQFDVPTAGKTIAFSHFFGNHGYLPDLVHLARNLDMHATFVASGPGIKHSKERVRSVGAIDVGPTLSFVLGIPAPRNARGKILDKIVEGTGDLRD